MKDVIDTNNWQALDPIEIQKLFKSLEIPWWIAGGWAIDLFIGRKTREHLDTDVLILRKDQLIIQEFLKDWKLYKTTKQGLKPWEKGEYLEIGVNSIWCKRESNSPWILQIMFLDADSKDWIYRRVSTIRRELSTIERKTDAGIPYLAPEIQLLFKAKKETISKDQSDFINVLPLLQVKELQWLLDALHIQFPQGHNWINLLENNIKEIKDL